VLLADQRSEAREAGRGAGTPRASDANTAVCYGWCAVALSLPAAKHCVTPKQSQAGKLANQRLTA